jgi:uncharacterized protein (TIGR02145 family)
LIGFPGNATVDWADVQVVIDDGIDPPTAYTPSGADADVSKTIHKYTGSGYAAFDDGTPGQEGQLTSQEGFWVEVTPAAAGKTVTLLIPSSGSGTVVSSGKVWMDRNLGVSQVATLINTDSAAYGDLYQWGRGTDGHQLRTSGTTTTLSSSDDPIHGDFIITSSSPYDWRVPQKDSLWQGVSGTNNPCPAGFRLPTDTEWEAEIENWTGIYSDAAFISPLKLVVAGYRESIGGTLNYVDSQGRYWSSTVDFESARHLEYNAGYARTTYSDRATGISVRCIQDYVLEDQLFTSNPTAIESGYVDQGAQDVVMERFQVDCDTAGDGILELADIAVDDLGTASSGDWDNLNIYISTDSTFDGGDTLIGQIPSWDGNLTYVPLSQGSVGDREVINGTSKYVFVVYDLNASIAVDTTLQSSVVDLYTSAPDNGAIGLYYNSDVITANVYRDVISPLTGQVWMDRNLGATRAATQYNDSEAYGDLYQWGRGTDGHQLRTSSTTSSQLIDIFATSPDFVILYVDWLESRNDNLWQGDGINNPCPDGLRVPTYNEWEAEFSTWTWGNPIDAYESPLKLVVAGYRSHIDGSISPPQDEVGYYWTNTLFGTHSRYMTYSGIQSAEIVETGERAHGYSVRCIYDGGGP